MRQKIFWTAILCVVLGTAGLLLAGVQEQQTQPPAVEPPAPTVDQAVLCTDVVDMNPQGTIGMEQAAAAPEAQQQAPAQAGGDGPFPLSPGKVFFFTVVSSTAPTTVKHVWYFGDQQAFALDLEVGGAHWRTWSSKTIPPDMSGKSGKVEIQDAKGTVLKTLTFTVK